MAIIYTPESEGVFMVEKRAHGSTANFHYE